MIDTDDDIDDIDADIASALESISNDKGAGSGDVVADDPTPELLNDPAEDDDVETEGDEGDTDSGDPQGDPADGEEPQGDADDAAPTSWGTAVKAEWTKLPPAVRKEIAKRERDIAAGFEKHAQRSKVADTYDQILAPVKPLLHQNGVNEFQFVNNLVAAEKALREKPVEAIKWLMNSYKIDPASITGGQAQADGPKGAGEAGQEDPKVTALLNRISQLEAGMQKNTAQFDQWRQAGEKEAHTRALSVVDEFINDPKRKPYIDDAVLTSMTTLMRSGAAKTLPDAYEMATWSNPAVRSKLLAAQASEKAASAKKAAAINVRSNGKARREKVDTDDLDAVIKASLDQMKSKGTYRS